MFIRHGIGALILSVVVQGSHGGAPIRFSDSLAWKDPALYSIVSERLRSQLQSPPLLVITVDERSLLCRKTQIASAQFPSVLVMQIAIGADSKRGTRLLTALKALARSVCDQAIGRQQLHAAMQRLARAGSAYASAFAQLRGTGIEAAVDELAFLARSSVVARIGGCGGLPTDAGELFLLADDAKFTDPQTFGALAFGVGCRNGGASPVAGPILSFNRLFHSALDQCLDQFKMDDCVSPLSDPSDEDERPAAKDDDADQSGTASQKATDRNTQIRKAMTAAGCSTSGTTCWLVDSEGRAGIPADRAAGMMVERRDSETSEVWVFLENSDRVVRIENADLYGPVSEEDGSIEPKDAMRLKESVDAVLLLTARETIGGAGTIGAAARTSGQALSPFVAFTLWLTGPYAAASVSYTVTSGVVGLLDDDFRQCPAIETPSGPVGYEDPGDGDPISEDDVFANCTCQALRAVQASAPALAQIGALRSSALCPNKEVSGRLRCLSFPLGPDGKPRQECLEYLSVDSGQGFRARLEGLCQLSQCPMIGNIATTGAVVIDRAGRATCDCFLVASSYPEGNHPRDLCRAIRCPEGSTLSVKSGICRCVRASGEVSTGRFLK